MEIVTIYPSGWIYIEPVMEMINELILRSLVITSKMIKRIGGSKT